MNTHAPTKAPTARPGNGGGQGEGTAPKAPSRPHVLRVENFAQIVDARIEFGDLTVLVGAQGTGKSLVLQWLKAAVDGRQLVQALRDAGGTTDQTHVLIDLIFGSGMGPAWCAESRVTFEGKAIRPEGLVRRGDGKPRLVFVPAHRAMLISDGWASPFQRLTSEVPVVARLFSQALFEQFSARDMRMLFPRERVLKRAYRNLIDQAVFHGGVVGVDVDRQHNKRLRLTHGDSQLPFMTWTAGQREFTPLLLGLYDVLVPRKVRKRPDVDWVVVEEPEMGLHPQAVTVFLLLVLDLLWRGYRVVLSTHSPQVLTLVWMLRRLRDSRARWTLVTEAFGVTSNAGLKQVAEAALQKEYRVWFLAFGQDGKVRSMDISSLDPGDDDPRVSGWGGLTEVSSRFGDAVRRARNEADG